MDDARLYGPDANTPTRQMQQTLQMTPVADNALELLLDPRGERMRRMGINVRKKVEVPELGPQNGTPENTLRIITAAKDEILVMLEHYSGEQNIYRTDGTVATYNELLTVAERILALHAFVHDIYMVFTRAMCEVFDRFYESERNAYDALKRVHVDGFYAEIEADAAYWEARAHTVPGVAEQLELFRN